MDDTLFGVNEEACSSCGLCQPACPQNALSMVDNIPVHGIEALFVCEKATEADSTVKCVHSQGLEQIAQFYQNGVRRAAVATGNCSICRYGKQARFDDHLETFNRLADSRGLPLIEIIGVDRTGWQKLAAKKEQTGVADTGRRAFLHSLIAPVLDDDGEAGDSKTSALSGFLTMVGRFEDPVLYVCVPGIDPKKCNGCDACINICPEATLTLVKDEQTALQYTFRAHLCTGCGVCIDICEVSAVSLDKMTTSSAIGLPLKACICRSCGCEFHVPDTGSNSEPTTGTEKGDLCRICFRTNHNRKLFQVLT